MESSDMIIDLLLWILFVAAMVKSLALSRRRQF